MTAEIITIGDELLIGQVVDTNSAYIAQRLSEWGITLYQITSVHDNKEHIQKALAEALTRVDLVLCTGGLGPTKDDITKQTFCDFFGTHLVEDESVKAHIHQLYAHRPEVLNRLTATQWLVPANCTVIQNPVGSAPIMMWESPLQLPHEGESKIAILFALPGVPKEMQYAMEHEVGDYLQHLAGREAIEHQNIHVQGIPESALAILIEEWENNLPEHLHLAYLPANGQICLRLSGKKAIADKADLHAEITVQLEKLKPIIEAYIIE